MEEKSSVAGKPMMHPSIKGISLASNIDDIWAAVSGDTALASTNIGFFSVSTWATTSLASETAELGGKIDSMMSDCAIRSANGTLVSPHDSALEMVAWDRP